MLKYIASIILCLLCAAAAAATPPSQVLPVQTASELSHDCEIYIAWFNAPDNVSAKYSADKMRSVGHCSGFFDGFIGALKLGFNTSSGQITVNVSDNLTPIEAITAFVNYMHHSPSSKSTVRADGVMMALINAHLITVEKMR
jgi:hypothetical protein